MARAGRRGAGTVPPMLVRARRRWRGPAPRGARAAAVTAALMVGALPFLGCGSSDEEATRQAAAANAEEVERLERRVGKLERQLRAIRRDLRASSGAAAGRAEAGRATGGGEEGAASTGAGPASGGSAPAGEAPSTEAETCGPDTAAEC